MEDGAGVLADGTRFEKQTSEEFGADGYWLRTNVVRGASADGKVSVHLGFGAHRWRGFRAHACGLKPIARCITGGMAAHCSRVP